MRKTVFCTAKGGKGNEKNAVSYRNKGHNTARRQSVSRTQTYIFRLTFCRKITAKGFKMAQRLSA